MTAKKLVVGLDLDNTLVCFRTSVLRKVAKKLGIPRRHKIRDYDFSAYPEDFRKEIWTFFHDPEYMMDLFVLPGVKKTLKLWKEQGHSLIVISARSRPVLQLTRQYIGKHFPQVEKVIFTGLGQPKIKLFKENNVDVWIDDSPRDTVEAAEHGIRTYLISNNRTSYNRNVKATKLLTTVSSIDRINIS